MIVRLLAALAAVLLLSALPAGAPPAAVANDAPACGEQLTRLHDDALSVPITGGKVDKERAGLVKIVEDAIALSAAGKPADAVVKLENLQAKVDDLLAAGRISAESAAQLTADIAAASVCLADA